MFNHRPTAQREHGAIVTYALSSAAASRTELMDIYFVLFSFFFFMSCTCCVQLHENKINDSLVLSIVHTNALLGREMERTKGSKEKIHGKHSEDESNFYSLSCKFFHNLLILLHLIWATVVWHVYTNIQLNSMSRKLKIYFTSQNYELLQNPNQTQRKRNTYTQRASESSSKWKKNREKRDKVCAKCILWVNSNSGHIKL